METPSAAPRDPPSGAPSSVERSHPWLRRLADVGALAGAGLALLYGLDTLGVDIGPLSTVHAYGPSLLGCIVLGLCLLLRAFLVAPGARRFAVAGALLLLLLSPFWLSALLQIGYALLY